MLIIGFTLWYVRKARCLKVFQDMVRPLEELIMDIWFAIISYLQGQLDDVCSHSNDVVKLPAYIFGRMKELILDN